MILITVVKSEYSNKYSVWTSPEALLQEYKTNFFASMNELLNRVLQRRVMLNTTTC